MIVELSFEGLASAVHAAEASLSAGDLGAARALYAAALALRVAAAGGRVARLTAHDALVVEQLAALASAFGEDSTAVALLETAAASADGRQDFVTADRSRIRLLQAHTGGGDLDEAQEVLRRLEPRIGRVDEIEFTEHGLRRFERQVAWPAPHKERLLPELYVQLGRLLTALGMPCAALTLLDRARALVAGRTHLVEDLAAALSLALTSAHLAAGDTMGAGSALDSLPALAPGGHPRWQLTATELRGQRAFLRGELAAAERAFEDVVKLAEEAGLPMPAVRATLNLAEIKFALNQVLDAERLLDEAWRRASEDQGLLRRVAALRARAHAPRLEPRDGPLPAIALQGGSPFEKERITDTATEPPRRRPGARASDFLARFEAAAFELRQQLSDEAQARKLLAAAIAEFGHSDSPLVQTRLRHLQALVLLFGSEVNRAKRSHALREAERLLSGVRAELARWELRYELYEAQRFLTRCRKELGHPVAEIDALLRSNQELLEVMTAGLPVVERAQFLLGKWRQEEEDLAVRVNELLAARDSTGWRLVRWLRTARGVHSLIDRAFANRIELTTEGRPRAPRPDSMSLSKSLLTHPRDQLTIAILVLPSSVVVLRRGWMESEVTVARVARAEIRGLVRRWHEAMTGLRDEPATLIAETLAKRLGLDAVLRSGATPGIRRIRFVPDDALHGFPFAALRVDGQYLVERFAVSIGHDSRFRSIRPRRGRAVALAVDGSFAGWPALPATAQQLADLEACLREHGLETEIHRNPVIDDQSALALLGRAWILHVSCHGAFEPDCPEATGLVMPADDGGTRVLNLRTLGRADLSGLEHLTLASCWGADNYILPGRWIASLPQVMMAAGARSVLGCLWEIDDQRSTKLLRDFYESLGVLRRDDALREVQLRCLRSPRSKEPNWWSGFQLYGETGRIPW